MIKLFPMLEVYITNVCNLTCRGCNRFNNYNFKGHQRWNDYAEDFELWSKRLEAPFITIIGGEPTLNPDLELWCSNLRRLWPDSRIMIQTNGTYQHVDLNKLWKKYRVTHSISLHDPATADELRKQWKSDEAFSEAYVFHQSAVIEQQGKYSLHHSDVDQSFGCCDMKHDHTLYKGKLWKCPSMALLPDFDQQFDLNLDNRRKDLLYSFKPLSADCTEEELQEFSTTKDTPIAQCEFCPQDIKWHTALGELKENLPAPNFGINLTEEQIIAQNQEEIRFYNSKNT